MCCTHLPCDRNLLTILQNDRTIFAVRVIEYDGDVGFGDPSLAPPVDEILLVCSAHLDAC
jgi:hypothetical protein